MRAATVWLALLSVLSPGCYEPELHAVPAPPPERETEFEDTLALLEAIEEGRFAERVGLDESLAALRVPDPVRIAFVRGTRVPRSEQGKIEQMVRELTANPQLRVDVIGCSDPSGSEALNERISQSRAQSVADRLRAWEVPDRKLGRVVGLGEDCEEQQRMVELRPFLVESEDDV